LKKKARRYIRKPPIKRQDDVQGIGYIIFSLIKISIAIQQNVMLFVQCLAKIPSSVLGV
jgi:hypothetical protein